MHPTETLPVESALRPLPGIPVAAVRAQVEAVTQLQQALMAAVGSDDSIRAINLSGALSNCVTTLTEMTVAPDLSDQVYDVREMIRAEIDNVVAVVRHELAEARES